MADSSRYERVASPTHSTGRRSSDEIEDDGEDEKPILDATPRANPAFTRNFKRQLQISLLLLAVSTLTLLRTSASLFHSPSSSLSRPFALPPTRVGPRPVTAPDGLPLYDSCSTEEFLDAVKRATVREDGKIKNIDFTTEVTNIELPPVEYSFDFPADSKCKPPRVYNQEEACELLGAYGGVYFLGDSFARHIVTALDIILHDRLDGGVVDYLTTTDCRGEAMYVEAKTCRDRVPFDTLDLPEDVPKLCGGKVEMTWRVRWRSAGGASNDTADFALWRSLQSAEAQSHSTLLLESWGIHFNYEFPRSVPWLTNIAKYIRNNAYPRPLNIFAGPHHAASNQPAVHVPTQGAVPQFEFIKQVDKFQRELTQGMRLEDGAGRMLDFFSATLGAQSFDGAHLSMQGNLEKAQLLLNLVDIAWGAIVKNGGMVAMSQE